MPWMPKQPVFELYQLHENCTFFTVFLFSLRPSNNVAHWAFSKSTAYMFQILKQHIHPNSLPCFLSPASGIYSSGPISRYFQDLLVKPKIGHTSTSHHPACVVKMLKCSLWHLYSGVPHSAFVVSWHHPILLNFLGTMCFQPRLVMYTVSKHGDLCSHPASYEFLSASSSSSSSLFLRIAIS